MSRRDRLKNLRKEIVENTSQVTEIKKATQKLVLKADISADDYKEIISIYDKWVPGMELVPFDIVRHDGELYQVLEGKGHTSQSDWAPDVAKSLFKHVAAPHTKDGEEIVLDWKQPQGKHDAYMTGDKMRYTDGVVYKSTMDYNTYPPDEYAKGWEVA